MIRLLFLSVISKSFELAFPSDAERFFFVFHLQEFFYK